MITRICLIRHGETAWNAERRLQGQLDVELNKNGHAQAVALARWLVKTEMIQEVFSSDLSRAWRTAESIASAFGLEPRVLPEMRERRYGIFEGLTYAEARRLHPEAYAAHDARIPDFVIPGGGESLLQFRDRVTSCLESLVENHGGKTMAVVVHGGVLDIVNRYLRGNALDVPRDFRIPNTGLNWVVREKGLWRIESWGQTPHLDARSLDELK